MAMMCPFYYLFIHVSTVCDEKKNGSVMIGGIYLRSGMNGSEWKVGLWGKR